MISKVAILQPYVPQYRVPLWGAVIDALGDAGIEARVFYGGSKAQMKERLGRGDLVRPSWSEEVSTWSLPLPSGLPRASFRRIPSSWNRALVLCEMQASNLNAWRMYVARRPYATFGHGASGTTVNTGMGARLEAAMNSRAAHVFTYTERGRAAVLKSTGLSSDRVTSFRNATDTRTLRKAILGIGKIDIVEFNRVHGIPNDARVALFVGALHSSKRIDLLIEAARYVWSRDSRWWLVVAGLGEMAQQLEELARQSGRLTMLGHARAIDYAPAAAQAEIILNPGRVGLVAADALAMGLPILTTHSSVSAPEIEYIESTPFLSSVADTSFPVTWLNWKRSKPSLPPMSEVPSVQSAADSIAGVLVKLCTSGRAA